MTTQVTELKPRDSISAAPLEWAEPTQVDYSDRFSVRTELGKYGLVDEVVVDWFTKQPKWFRIVRTKAWSLRSLAAAKADGFPVGSAVGAWQVVARSGDEIVFHDSMSFMEFWFCFSLDPGDSRTVDAATSVRFLWRRSGPFLFNFVRPGHRRLVPQILSKAVA